MSSAIRHRRHRRRSTLARSQNGSTTTRTLLSDATVRPTRAGQHPYTPATSAQVPRSTHRVTSNPGHKRGGRSPSDPGRGCWVSVGRAAAPCRSRTDGPRGCRYRDGRSSGVWDRAPLTSPSPSCWRSSGSGAGQRAGRLACQARVGVLDGSVGGAQRLATGARGVAGYHSAMNGCSPAATASISSWSLRARTAMVTDGSITTSAR